MSVSPKVIINDPESNNFRSRLQFSSFHMRLVSHCLVINFYNLNSNISKVEIPSNIVMKKSRPSIFIPCLVFAWGIVCTFMGFVKSFDGLIAARLFLGVTEGGLFPGLSFL
jgi:MFS family permease